jgi:hypothetical protein
VTVDFYIESRSNDRLYYVSQQSDPLDCRDSSRCVFIFQPCEAGASVERYCSQFTISRIRK